MDWFKLIKGFYPKYWNESMVADAVVAGKITPEQYKEITGKDYPVAKDPEPVEEQGSELPGADASDEPRIEQ